MHESAEDPVRRDAPAARRNLHEALFWTALGVVIFVASWRMDRLQSQDINPYTIPGLLPGLLGIAMVLAGALMALRSAREGAFAARARAGTREASKAPGVSSTSRSCAGGAIRWRRSCWVSCSAACWTRTCGAASC